MKSLNTQSLPNLVVLLIFMLMSIDDPSQHWQQVYTQCRNTTYFDLSMWQRECGLWIVNWLVILLDQNIVSWWGCTLYYGFWNIQCAIISKIKFVWLFCKITNCFRVSFWLWVWSRYWRLQKLLYRRINCSPWI